VKRQGRPRTVFKSPALPAPPEFHWTLAQVAASVQLTVAAIRLRIENADLKAVQLGKEWRVADSEYRAWLERNRIKPSAQASEGSQAA
jgi:hypothetical protein